MMPLLIAEVLAQTDGTTPNLWVLLGSIIASRAEVDREERIPAGKGPGEDRSRREPGRQRDGKEAAG